MTLTPPPPIHLHLGSKADTRRLAAVFAHELNAGDVLLLSGGLAAGKTFFVCAAVAALGSKDPVSSPTYSIANIYQCPTAQVLHIDAYRLKSNAEFIDLGLEDELARSITFIEWGAGLADEFDQWLRLDLTPDPADEFARNATLSAHGAQATRLLPQIKAAFNRGRP